MKVLFSILKFVAIFVVLVTFVLAAGISFYTYYRPLHIISFIKTYLVPEEVPQKIHIKGITVLGDSQSDEYRADDNRGDNFPTTTYNWVEILSQERDIHFGEWGIREEPRRSGYEYNWSRSGATAASLIESGQHIGAAEQIKNGDVNIAIIYIGANDFAPYITEDGYQSIYNEELSDAQIERKINRLVADIETAIDTVQKAQPDKIMLIKVPDWGNHIGIKVAFPLPHKRYLVTQAIKETNNKLEKMATEREITTVDPNLFYTNIPKTSGQPIIGERQLKWIHLNNNPDNVFLKDGVHTGTAINALFANYIIDTLNPFLTRTIVPLSNEEMYEISGLD